MRYVGPWIAVWAGIFGLLTSVVSGQAAEQPSPLLVVPTPVNLLPSSETTVLPVPHSIAQPGTVESVAVPLPTAAEAGLPLLVLMGLCQWWKVSQRRHRNQARTEDHP